MKVLCPSCGQRFNTSEPQSGDFELRGRYENTPVVKCLKCGQLAFLRLLRRRADPVPADVATHLKREWAAWTSPYATAIRWAEREERREAYRASVGESGPPYEGPGVKIPAWWYFWPAGHDESLDLNRVVFLEENMPPELHRLSLAELTEVGVQQIPGREGDRPSRSGLRRCAPSTLVRCGATGFRRGLHAPHRRVPRLLW